MKSLIDKLLLNNNLKSDSYILGIHAYSHDSSACLLKNGKIVCLFEEERFNRKKHSSEFPINAILNCLKFENISLNQIERICFSARPDLEIFGNLKYFLSGLPATISLLKSEMGIDTGLSEFQRIKKYLFLKSEFKKYFPNNNIPKISNFEHHLCHAASAYYCSPFSRAAVITWDGRGESNTTAFFVGAKANLKKISEVKVPHSIGNIYSAFTSFLGFKPTYDEWKVMGLSAYGKPQYYNEIEKMIYVKGLNFEIDLSYFRYHTHGHNSWFSTKLNHLLGPPRSKSEKITERHQNIACSLQRVIEDKGLALAINLHKHTNEDNLCIAGGVAQNILLNSKIISNSGFKNIFIQPVCTDAGNSLGAAKIRFYKKSKRFEGEKKFLINLGNSYSDKNILESAKMFSLKINFIDNIAQTAANLIQEGKIIGWFQGRMEAGPRALGYRSILCDPTRNDLKDKLNIIVKRRERFRPFAPSCTEEDFLQYFETPNDLASEYMVLSAKVRQEYRQKLSAITHIDGTARLHTVSKENNSLFWNLLKEFEKISNFPILLNTSFNINEPIIEHPSQAFHILKNEELDYIFIGSYKISK